MPEPSAHRCGFAAVVGRPNVGKSTLVNQLVGQKLSITSRKPQTTRHRILGIKTQTHSQIVYIDTPGIHAGARRALNRYMNRTADGALDGVDVVIFVVEALRWRADDEHVLGRIRRAHAPVILAINKVDRVDDKNRLLPFITELSSHMTFAEVIPISARRGTQLEVLESRVVEQLPEGEPVFPRDQLTDRSERFFTAEIVREKLTRRLGQELPYQLSVEVEQFEETQSLIRIGAIIWVERRTHKPIVIGRGGEGLKAAGSEARADLQAHFGRQIHLQLWVKVKEGWSNDERALLRLGYPD